MVTPEQRQQEAEKYKHVYSVMPNYRMGVQRKQDAFVDLEWARKLGCESYLDIGCGRAETLAKAEELGFTKVMGTDVVPELCDGQRVQQIFVHELFQFESESFDCVSSFDVIEHLHPGDDRLLIGALGRIARNCLMLTANNRRSVDPTTGNDLHINKRPYPEWDQMIREVLEPDWQIEWCKDKRYVSETWRAVR